MMPVCNAHRVRRFCIPLLGLMGCVVLLLSGCSSSSSDVQPAPENATVYEDVRGAFQSPATGGRDMIVHHEPVPGVMDAMLMTLPIDRPGSLDTLRTGTPITFDLHVADAAIQARDIRVLPDTTTLNLPPDAPADTSARPLP